MNAPYPSASTGLWQGKFQAISIEYQLLSRHRGRDSFYWMEGYGQAEIVQASSPAGRLGAKRLFRELRRG